MSDGASTVIELSVVEERFRACCRGCAECASHLGGAHRIGVGQKEHDAVEPAERLSVESADPADADDPDTEW